MKIESSAFTAGAIIPKKYTCQGEDINPPLTVSGLPEGTKSVALIVDDPDAPMGTWVHWVVYNIPVQSPLSISENSIPGAEGPNNFGQVHYGGPCPPSGTHRYFFKAYALDTELSVDEKMTKAELEKAMGGHLLAQAELIGLYKK